MSQPVLRGSRVPALLMMPSWAEWAYAPPYVYGEPLCHGVLKSTREINAPSYKGQILPSLEVP